MLIPLHLNSKPLFVLRRTRQEMEELGLGQVPLEMTLAFEKLSGLQFAPERNPKAKFMAHLWEDVKYR